MDDFTKNFRLFAWVENYNEEFIARDWLLKAIDENFSREGITISYPTEVEIDQEQTESKDYSSLPQEDISR